MCKLELVGAQPLIVKSKIGISKYNFRFHFGIIEFKNSKKVG